MNEKLRASLRAAALLGGCALLAVGLLETMERLTAPRIEAARQRHALAQLAVVLPPALYDNNPLTDTVQVVAPQWLGSTQPLQVRRARRGDAETALVLEAVAPDGYAGPIRLVLGVKADGEILAVRILEHRETPGLGDPIEAERSDWIQRFSSLALGRPPLPAWRVQRDGGEFDQFAGATVTPRAVVGAVRRALQFIDKHAAELYAAVPGSVLEFGDGPET